MSAARPEDLHRLFTEAFNSGDLDAVMKLYEPNASLVPQPGQVTTGEAANREALRQFLALKGRISITTVFVISAGDLALLRGEWRLAGTGPDGKPVDMSGKNVEVARRQPNGDWLFAIDHAFGAA
ncbi:MAG: hypothetical protein K0S45_99 [Nitrospira sp.]|jgi:uncharacterized protein (TIGR02246 family)|nr:hypothetical protein [Nitrospira sp.]